MSKHQVGSNHSIMPKVSSHIHLEQQPAREYRRKVVGGYEISTPSATAWASRLSGRALHPYHNAPSVLRIIRDKLRPHGANFMNVGEEAVPTFMIVTRSARFRGYKNMDPKLIPQFEEGEREAVARKLLEEEGIQSYTFKSALR